MLKKETLAKIKFRLLMEQSRRPKAEITDYFKLLYQACFGVAHIAENKNMFHHYLLEELVTVSASQDLPLMEPITIFEPMARVHLARFLFEGMSVEKLIDICMKTADSFRKKTRDDFLIYAKELPQILTEFPFRFATADIASVIGSYPFESLPPFRHSPAYRELYRPHYRLVTPELFDRELS